jgi:putative transposase
MPRANRHILAGHTYHITHRCHDRAFLLKFARDRQAYRDLLGEGVRSGGVSLLNYCLTSNHVHLLLRAERMEALARLIQRVAGEVAQAYNQRKRRTGAFWSDRYHATMIENGEHLWRCMRYIDLNMVRAGVVGHPSEWDWTGWGELMGERRRNRLLDLDALLLALEADTLEHFRRQYAAGVAEALAGRQLEREPWWSEAVAVGSEAYTAAVEKELLGDYTRRRLEKKAGPEGVMILREVGESYGFENSLEKSPIGLYAAVKSGLTP